jgi:hypothetical protein
MNKKTKSRTDEPRSTAQEGKLGMDVRVGFISVFLSLIPAMAQHLVHVRPGVVNYARGNFYLDDKKMQFPADQYREIPEGKNLRTGNGWVELQLGPNAFLWVGGSGVIRMENANLTNVQLRVESGSILLWVSGYTKKNKTIIHFRDASIEPRQNGFYRFDSDSAQLRVFNGEAEVRWSGNISIVKRGRAAALNSGWKITKFDVKQTDPLQAIVSGRSRLIEGVMLKAHMEQLRRERSPQKKITPAEAMEAAQRAYREKIEQQRIQDYNEARQQQELLRQMNPNP